MINEGKRMELGSQIKRHRTERGLSQDDLAAKIYVSRQTVSSWENDKTYPDVESLLLLSVLFDVTVDELIKGDVEAMKEAISNDYKKMMALTWAGFGIVILGVAAAIAGISWWGWDAVPSGIIGLLIWGFGMVLLARVERIKKEHDLDSRILEGRARRSQQSAQPACPSASRAQGRDPHTSFRHRRCPRRILCLQVRHLRIASAQTICTSHRHALSMAFIYDYFNNGQKAPLFFMFL